MIDTHAHLSSRFQQDVNLERLRWVVLSASCQQDSLDNLELAKNNPKLLPSVGIHPTEIGDNIDEQINFVDELCNQNSNIVSIGECGLEFVEGVDKKRQEILFRGQIALSLKYEKPLIVHSKDASDETPAILLDYKKLKGVIHCYTGGKKRIKKYLEISPDWYFGIDGNITYEIGLDQVVMNIPKDRLILETDTPFLAPLPHRGEQNRPEWVEFTYKKVAEIWGLDFEKTEELIDNNARRLFSVKNEI
jgi:TatD DNase family protein